MGRVKVTGYFTPEADEQDASDRSGLTSRAYDSLIADSDGVGLRVADLDDIKVEAVAE